MFQSKRDILSETKYIELVLVADHQEVSENTTADDNKNDFFIYIVSNGSQPHQGVASLATHNVNGAQKQYWQVSWWLVCVYVCFMLATSPSSFLPVVFLAQRGATCWGRRSEHYDDEIPHRGVQLQA